MFFVVFYQSDAYIICYSKTPQGSLTIFLQGIAKRNKYLIRLAGYIHETWYTGRGYFIVSTQPDQCNNNI